MALHKRVSSLLHAKGKPRHRTQDAETQVKDAKEDLEQRQQSA